MLFDEKVEDEDVLAFLIHKDTGRIYVGLVSTHSGCAYGWGLEEHEYVQAKWTTGKSKNTISIKAPREEGRHYVDMVISTYQSKKVLLNSIKYGKTHLAQYWYKDGKFHREGGPAVVYTDGTRMWYKEGALHRRKGPAVKEINADTQWFHHGKLHREKGPAVIRQDGTKIWYQNGVEHRKKGPAKVSESGDREWYKEGMLHRNDGPAVIKNTGEKIWYKNGVASPRNILRLV